MEQLPKNVRLAGTQDAQPKLENGHSHALDQYIPLKSLCVIRKKTENHKDNIAVPDLA